MATHAPTRPSRIRTRLTIRDLLKPHTGALVLGFVCVIGETLANLAEPWPIKIVLDSVLRHKTDHTDMLRWIQSIAGADPMSILTFAVVAVLAIAAVDAISSYGEKYLTTSIGQWITYDLRRAIYSHVQRLSLAFHDEKRTGDLITRVTDDVDAIQSFITQGLLGLFVNLLTLVGIVGVMFYLNWRFTLVALSVAPPLFFIVFTYTRRIKKATREVRKKEGEIISVVEEVLSSIRVVKAFAREDYEIRRLEEQGLEQVEIALRARALKAKLTPIVNMIVALGTALVLWFGARLVLAGTLTVGSLVIFIFYLGKMYKPMQELSKLTDTYTKAAIGYERIQEVMQTSDEIKDSRHARTAPKLKGDIEFDRVCFAYKEDTPILRDVSFKVKAGQIAALVGPTGAGKTSIISLIARFYDPTSGVVKIDGHDIRDFRQKSLRQQVSFVLQDNVLFHAPLWQNIAYGKPEARRDEIVRAAEMANAMEFIEKLPEGFDTVIGERGMTLSGGQRQRIAIARAVIRNTPILVLDEPTSGLDAASEKLVFDALDRLMKDRTTIVIAHRLSTVRNADVIFVVDDGVIAETGNHDELMALGGIYARLHDLQFRPDLEDELRIRA
ncbi:MAG: ABC transporter ATP-binding protein [Terriglobales bacterium]